MFDALIYDSDEEVWLRFTEASAVHIAKTNEEVAAVLDTIEAACAEGKYAVGYVSFEAAGAFDCALVHHPAGSLPLAAFGIFLQLFDVTGGELSFCSFREDRSFPSVLQTFFKPKSKFSTPLIGDFASEVSMIGSSSCWPP